MSSETKVKLKSCDNEMFEVDLLIVDESPTLKNMIEDMGSDKVISFSSISGKILTKILEYCEFHVESQINSEEKPALPEDEIKRWDGEFIKVDNATLFDLIQAADELKLENLLDLTCKAVADKMLGKNVEEIREIFNLDNDFTPEEEAEIRECIQCGPCPGPDVVRV